MFSLSSLILDCVKYGKNIEDISKILNDNNFDVTTEHWIIVLAFIKENLPQITENLKQTEIDPDSKFVSLFWTQKLDVKSSNVDNIKERSFVLDFGHRKSSKEDHFEFELSAKELIDLHSNLRECTRSIENILNKN